ncbi:MAG: hypothetical protein HY289_03295 [Planctomycetes bacterium]|nr:hypothetical protein [Planctomycetota bacterium]
MKAETESISEDEWLIRLVWHDRLTNRVPIISPNAFEPRDTETDGISLYRLDCLRDPTDALIPIAEAKRPRYAIVKIPASLLKSLGLTAQPNPRQDVPGHIVIPELNIIDYKRDKARFTPIKLRLAEAASENIVRRPITS